MLDDRNTTASARDAGSETPLNSFQCLAIAVPALLLGFWSGHGAYHMLCIGDPVRMTAGELESGTAEPGLWNEVSGVLLLEKAHVHRSRRSTSYYVPLVSPAWRPGGYVAVIARFADLPQERVGVFQGITPGHHGVPLSAAEGLNQAGVLLAESCLLLKADETPGSKAMVHSIGLLAALFGIGLAIYKWPAAAQDSGTGQDARPRA